MISRLMVQVNDPANMDAVVAGVQEAGFPNIRILQSGAGVINVFGTFDDDVDTPPTQFDPARMEDYCVYVWSRTDEKHRIVLEQFTKHGDTVEFGENEYDNWRND